MTGLDEEVQFNIILDMYPKGKLNRSAPVNQTYFPAHLLQEKDKDENEVYYDTSDELSEHVRHSTSVLTSKREEVQKQNDSDTGLRPDIEQDHHRGMGMYMVSLSIRM